MRFKNISDQELKVKLKERGSDFERLIEHHNTHHYSLEKILKAFRDNHIETKIVQRNNYTRKDIDWSNCVFTCGGDGTYLLASAKISSNTKPVIGINTDVISSEGHLLLPKKHSINFADSLGKLLEGDFKWVPRARIRIHLEGQNLANIQPIELHDQVLNHLEHRYVEHIAENRFTQISKADTTSNNNHGDKSQSKLHRIPPLALNEVFIGESLSARVSYYQMSIDNGPVFKQKSSGIIICTGTGSTSWCYNINKMSENSIRKLLQLVNKEIRGQTKNKNQIIPYDDDTFIQTITNKFNDSIVFEPGHMRMSYTIRDPIINKIFVNETNRGFAQKIVVQSRCFDASIVIDGGCSYQFNDGAKAILETLPEDTLRTVSINDE
jgi:NAD+ kinase